MKMVSGLPSPRTGANNRAVREVAALVGASVFHQGRSTIAFVFGVVPGQVVDVSACPINHAGAGTSPDPTAAAGVE